MKSSRAAPVANLETTNSLSYSFWIEDSGVVSHQN